MVGAQSVISASERDRNTGHRDRDVSKAQSEVAELEVPDDSHFAFGRGKTSEDIIRLKLQYVLIVFQQRGVPFAEDAVGDGRCSAADFVKSRFACLTIAQYIIGQIV